MIKFNRLRHPAARPQDPAELAGLRDQVAQ